MVLPKDWKVVCCGLGDRVRVHRDVVWIISGTPLLHHE